MTQSILSFRSYDVTETHVSVISIRGTVAGVIIAVGRFMAIVGIIAAEVLININAGYFIFTVFIWYIILTVSTLFLEKETTGMAID